MNKNELIADKIEAAVGRMFRHFELHPTITFEYFLFYYPEKDGRCFIVIFFKDKKQLRQVLEGGICYQLYMFLNNELGNIAEISNAQQSIFFKSGIRPIEKIDIDNLSDLLLREYDALTKNGGKDAHNTCTSCGHNFDDHQLLGNQKEGSSFPTEGWMICGDDNCECFKTWSINYNFNNTEKK